MWGGLTRVVRAQPVEPYASVPGDYADYVEGYLYKMRHFNELHPGDVVLDGDDYWLLKASVQRLERLQRTAGYAKFHLLDFDEALTIARDYPEVGELPKAEVEFLEGVFYADAIRYGFYGEKNMTRITEKIPSRVVVKIPHSGHFLYRGLPLELYERIKRDVGDRVLLTSGVRGIMKQFQLFLRKAYDNGGNLSLASRSLAPPGFSFHGISDFDVGQRGFGDDNFTLRFTSSEVYAKLKKLAYIDLRYPQDNMLGVRFEPWHIKVTPAA